MTPIRIPLCYLLLLLTAMLGSVSNANDNEQFRAILELESKIQSVVSTNMESCVAVSDGIGFGSGVIVSEDGLVLTAGHVMSTNQEYEIIFPSGRTARAIPLGRNLNIDAGMVKIIDPGPWPVAPLSTTTPQLGDWTINLGHSGGFELGRKPPVRTGRYIRKRGHQLVTDAVLIGGDSGGPLFNLNGEVIGIHSSIGDSVAENRHVDIAEFRRSWDRMFRGESWGELPRLGAEPPKDFKRAKIGVTVNRKATRAQISRVRSGSPADLIGIQANDVVTEFDGEQITGPVQLIEKIKQKEPGDVCTITVDRNGQLHRFMIHLKRFD